MRRPSRPSLNVLALWAMLLAVSVVSGVALAANYDFRYEASGHPLLTPVQVFDDGGKTWVQLKRQDPPPAFFAITPAGQALLTATRSPDGQFYIIDRVERLFMVALGSTKAMVRYTGEGRNDAPALFGSAKPSLVTGSPPAALPAEKILSSRRVKPVQAALVAIDPPKPTPTPEVPAPMALEIPPAVPEVGTAGLMPEIQNSKPVTSVGSPEGIKSSPVADLAAPVVLSSGPSAPDATPAVKSLPPQDSKPVQTAVVAADPPKPAPAPPDPEAPAPTPLVPVALGPAVDSTGHRLAMPDSPPAPSVGAPETIKPAPVAEPPVPVLKESQTVIPVVVPTPLLSLRVAQGDALVFVLRDFLHTHGITVVWGGGEGTARSNGHYEGATSLAVADALLRAYRLQGFFVRANKTLYVR